MARLVRYSARLRTSVRLCEAETAETAVTDGGAFDVPAYEALRDAEIVEKADEFAAQERFTALCGAMNPTIASAAACRGHIAAVGCWGHRRCHGDSFASRASTLGLEAPWWARLIRGVPCTWQGGAL